MTHKGVSLMLESNDAWRRCRMGQAAGATGER